MGRRQFAQALVLVLIALEGCATTEPSCGNILQPPAALAHFPSRPVILSELPPDLLESTCFAFGAPRGAQACTNFGGGPPLVVLPEIDGKSITIQVQMCALRHETGHVQQFFRGLPLDHVGWS